MRRLPRGQTERAVLARPFGRKFAKASAFAKTFLKTAGRIRIMKGYGTTGTAAMSTLPPKDMCGAIARVC